MSLSAAVAAPGLAAGAPQTHATREPPGARVSLFQKSPDKVKAVTAGTSPPIHTMVAIVDPLGETYDASHILSATVP